MCGDDSAVDCVWICVAQSERRLRFVFLRTEKCSSAVKMEYGFPIVVEDYDKTDDVQIWETELHDFIVWYIVPGKVM